MLTHLGLIMHNSGMHINRSLSPNKAMNYTWFVGLKVTILNFEN